MKDPRIRKMAEVLVNYSTEMKKGDKVYISGSDITMPLLKELFRSSLKVGAYPQVHIECDGISEIMLKEGSDEQITYESPISRYIVENYDVLIHVHGGYNLKALSNIDPVKKQLAAQGRKEIVRIYMERAAKKELRWCTCQFPTHSSAQEAGMSLDEYEDFVYGDYLPDTEDPVGYWQQFSTSQQKIVDWFKGKERVHVIGPETDLGLNITNRVFTNCDGRKDRIRSFL